MHRDAYRDQRRRRGTPLLTRSALVRLPVRIIDPVRSGSLVGSPGPPHRIPAVLRPLGNLPPDLLRCVFPLAALLASVRLRQSNRTGADRFTVPVHADAS